MVHGPSHAVKEANKQQQVNKSESKCRQDMKGCGIGAGVKGRLGVEEIMRAEVSRPCQTRRMLSYRGRLNMAEAEKSRNGNIPWL